MHAVGAFVALRQLLPYTVAKLVEDDVVAAGKGCNGYDTFDLFIEKDVLSEGGLYELEHFLNRLLHENNLLLIKLMQWLPFPYNPNRCTINNSPAYLRSETKFWAHVFLYITDTLTPLTTYVSVDYYDQPPYGISINTDGSPLKHKNMLWHCNRRE